MGLRIADGEIQVDVQAAGVGTDVAVAAGQGGSGSAGGNIVFSSYKTADDSSRTNLVTVHSSGHLLLLQDSSALRLGEGADVTLTHDGGEGADLVAAGAMDIQAGAASKINTTAGNLTLDSEAANLVLDGHTGVDIDASNSGKVTIDGAGGIDIGVNADVAVDFHADTFDLDAAGALTMDAGAASHLKTSSGDLDVEAAGELDLDGATVKLDSAGQMDITSVAAMNLSSAAFDVDASGVVGIDSDDAMTLGGASVDIDADGGALSLDGSSGINIGLAANVAVDFHASSWDLDATSSVTIDASSFSVGADGSTGAISMNSTAGVTLDGASASRLKTSSGDLDVEAAGELDLDGNTVKLDSAGQMDVTSGAAMNLSSAAFDIDASGVVGIDSDSVMTLGAASFDINSDGNIAMDCTAGSIAMNSTTNSNLSVAGNDDSSAVTLTLASSNSGSEDGNIILSADKVTINANLDVNGTTTTIDTTSVAISDHNVVLDRDNDTGTVIDGCGLTLQSNEAGAADVTFVSANSADRMDLKKGTDYHKLAAGQYFVDGTSNHMALSSNVLTLTAASSFEVASAGDIVLDSEGAVVIDGNGVQLEFGSADSGEHISGNGTDLSIASGADINLNASSNVNIPADVGLTFGDDNEKIEGDGTDLTVNGNNIKLTAVEDVILEADTGLVLDGSGDAKIESDAQDISFSVPSDGDINIPANIGLTFGDDNEKIEGDGTDLTVSGNNIKLTVAEDVILNADTGLVLDGSGDDKLESDGTDLTISVGAGDLILGLASGQTLKPSSNNQVDLGSETNRFANIYTGDLDLTNDRGSWTLIEEENFISFRNNKTGRRFAMVMEDITDRGDYGPGNDGRM